MWDMMEEGGIRRFVEGDEVCIGFAVETSDVLVECLRWKVNKLGWDES